MNKKSEIKLSQHFLYSHLFTKYRHPITIRKPYRQDAAAAHIFNSTAFEQCCARLCDVNKPCASENAAILF